METRNKVTEDSTASKSASKHGTVRRTHVNEVIYPSLAAAVGCLAVTTTMMAETTNKDDDVNYSILT